MMFSVYTFVVRDAANSNVIAHAAFFFTSQTLVIEELGDEHQTAVIGVRSGVRVLTLHNRDDDPRSCETWDLTVSKLLKGIYDTDYVEHLS